MDWKEQRQTITKKMIASRVFQREDNIYKMSVIQGYSICAWKRWNLPWRMEKRLV